jgi:ribosomal RNA-processing protein 12
VIIERLVRRCGVEPVAAACPQDDYRLMTHIRKQQSRKERRRAGSEVGSQVGTRSTASDACTGSSSQLLVATALLPTA